MSAYELGVGIGSLLITVVGALLVFKGYITWNAGSTPAATQPLAVRNTVPAPAPTPTSSATAATATADDFFGGTILPATNMAPTGPNPAVTDARWHPDYSSAGFNAASTPSKNSTGLIVLAIGLLVLGVGLFQSYQAFLAPSRGIEFPDQLIGMDRNETATDLLKETQDQLAVAPGVFGEAELEGAVYMSGERVLYVVAGETDGTDPAEYDAFSEGFEQAFAASGTGTGPTLKEVESGSLGGEMWCSHAPAEGASLCVWLDEQTFGIILLSAEGTDVSDSAVEIREAVVN